MGRSKNEDKEPADGHFSFTKGGDVVFNFNAHAVFGNNDFFNQLRQAQLEYSTSRPKPDKEEVALRQPDWVSFMQPHFSISKSGKFSFGTSNAYQELTRSVINGEEEFGEEIRVQRRTMIDSVIEGRIANLQITR